ncbi:MAG: hypothetical protein E7293_07220 [Lachnospiraceae bacterium]|nr:hypothetical protein [Lachnospiraceae bacterium]
MTQNNEIRGLTRLDELNLVDKFLFDQTMEDPEAYQALVGILLENEVHLLSGAETEKELGISPQLRAIRLDVVGMDEQGRMLYPDCTL